MCYSDHCLLLFFPGRSWIVKVDRVGSKMTFGVLRSEDISGEIDSVCHDSSWSNELLIILYLRELGIRRNFIDNTQHLSYLFISWFTVGKLSRDSDRPLLPRIQLLRVLFETYTGPSSLRSLILSRPSPVFPSVYTTWPVRRKSVGPLPSFTRDIGGPIHWTPHMNWKD